MKLDNQVCSPEQGRRLVELGVKLRALFWHMPAKDGPHGPYVRYGWHSDAVAPAFSAAELLDIFPASVNNCALIIEKDDVMVCEDCEPEISYCAGYKEGNYFSIGCGEYTIARACAGLLIILLEKKYINFLTPVREKTCRDNGYRTNIKTT